MMNEINQMDKLIFEDFNSKKEEREWLLKFDSLISSSAFKKYEDAEKSLRKELLESKECKQYFMALKEYDKRASKDIDDDLEKTPQYLRWLYKKYDKVVELIKTEIDDYE